MQKGGFDEEQDEKTPGRAIIKGLTELVETVELGTPVEQKYTVRTVDLDLKPREYDREDVVGTRCLLKASQAVFAKFLGVKTTTVQAWEQGHRPPSGVACRMMDEIRRDPGYWLARLRESIVAKPADCKS